MTNLEAKLVLQAYRPTGEDASDPLVREALQQVERDPELRKWFEAELALENRIQCRLNEAVPIPRKLKANLLALQKISRPSRWWPQPWQLAATAALAIALATLAALALRTRNPNLVESFREATTLCSLQQKDHVTYEPRNLMKIEQWLQAQGFSTNFDLPPALSAAGAQGCKVIEWNQQKVAMICFVSSKGEHMDLFVMDNRGNALLPGGESPQFSAENGLETACWCRGHNVYLLAGKDMAALRNAIQSI